MSVLKLTGCSGPSGGAGSGVVAHDGVGLAEMVRAGLVSPRELVCPLGHKRLEGRDVGARAVQQHKSPSALGPVACGRFRVNHAVCSFRRCEIHLLKKFAVFRVS